MESSTPLLPSLLNHIQNHKLIAEKSSAGEKESPTENSWAPGGYKLQITDMITCSNIMSTSGEPNFQVDDLLDLPFEDDELGSPLIPHAEAPLSLPGFAQRHSASSSESKFQLNFEAAELNNEEPPTYGLCVPPDELVHQLEWLSAFNEDNFFTGEDTKLLSSLPTVSRASSGIITCAEAPRREKFHKQSPISVLEQGSHLHANPCALNHAYKAHRVRKARTGGRVWSVDILKPILLENRIKASCETSKLLLTSGSSAFSQSSCSFLQHDESGRPYKKIKQVGTNNCTADSALIRKCMHCLVQKTPQWRAGPLGPKTLCNACGVRYKSGRLVPEYRPAASPSFVNEVHSNSHRRILEMRRTKEIESHVVEDHKYKVEGVEEVYKTDLRGESCLAYDTSEENLHTFHMHASMVSSTESSLCKEDVAGDDSEVIRDEDSLGKGPSGKAGIVLCEADIASNEDYLHEIGGKTREDTLICKKEGMQLNGCTCNMEAACQRKPTCTKDTIVNVIEQNCVDTTVQNSINSSAIRTILEVDREKTDEENGCTHACSEFGKE